MFKAFWWQTFTSKFGPHPRKLSKEITQGRHVTVTDVTLDSTVRISDSYKEAPYLSVCYPVLYLCIIQALTTNILSSKTRRCVTRMIETTAFSETSLKVYKSTRRHIHNISVFWMRVFFLFEWYHLYEDVSEESTFLILWGNNGFLPRHVSRYATATPNSVQNVIWG